MQRLIVLALIGFVAQLIDGSLGMAYGVTTTSMLFLYGVPVATASASVHMAELVTTAASGLSHVRFGNVDKAVVIRLIIPGSIGAFVGAIFLSHLPGDVAKPYVSLFLLLLGFYVLIRFLLQIKPKIKRNLKGGFLFPLGLFAGFADATGGGGWGPLTTPVLISRNPNEARKVIGSVDTSEFAIASSATLGFLISLGLKDYNWLWVSALIIGGVIAAPIAAWLVRMMPIQLLGVLVGSVIIITNLKTILSVLAIETQIQWVAFTLIGVLLLGCIIHAIYRHLKIKQSP